MAFASQHKAQRIAQGDTKCPMSSPVAGAALLRACSLKKYSLAVHSALFKYINCHGNNALIGMGAAWWPPQTQDKNQWRY